MNSVASFSGSIVVEAQDENIDGKVCEGGVANLAIDGHPPPNSWPPVRRYSLGE